MVKAYLNFIFLIGIGVLPNLFCYNSFSNRIIPNVGDSTKKLIVTALDVPQLKSLICYLNNKDSTCYIPKDAWLSLSNVGDTLYVEAIYKRRKESDKFMLYNLFSPPELEQLDFNSLIAKKIRYKGLTVKSPTYLSIRVFTKLYPYDSKKDYEKYHSVTEFLVFEKQYSFLTSIRIIKIDDIKQWSL